MHWTPKQYQIALQDDPYQLEAHNNLANLICRTDPDEARKHYEFVLQANPRDALAHNNLATLLARQRRFGEAIRRKAADHSTAPLFFGIQAARVQPRLRAMRARQPDPREKRARSKASAPALGVANARA